VTEIPAEGRVRAVIENVTPRVDDGRFPVKRVVGETLVVEADVFADGHDEVRAMLAWSRAGDDGQWQTVEMESLGNDRWRASFPLAEIGRYRYTVTGWVDHWRTWVHDLLKRVDAAQDVTVDLQIGAAIVEAAAARAKGADRQTLTKAAANLTTEQALDEKLSTLVDRYPDLTWSATLDAPLDVVVDPERARFSAWYELFARSASPDPKRHGTFDDVIARLDYVAGMGFDVVYLPPVSPIGRQFRKGPNNLPSEDPGDPGVPWAIGGPEGGHTSVNPALWLAG